MDLIKTKVMLNENSTTSTVAVDGNIMTRVVDLLPEIKRRIAHEWAAFSKVVNIKKSRKASMNIKRKVHNEYVLPVMVYGSETWALKKAPIELLSVAQCKMEHIMVGITLRDHTHPTPDRRHDGRYQEGNTGIGGTRCTVQRQQMDYRVVVKYRYLYLYLYLSTILSVLDVLEYLIDKNAKYLYLYLT